MVMKMILCFFLGSFVQEIGKRGQYPLMNYFAAEDLGRSRRSIKSRNSRKCRSDPCSSDKDCGYGICEKTLWRGVLRTR